MHRTERDPTDLRLDAALDAWRRDVSTATPRPALAERVLAAVARGDDEDARFRRLARTYAAAAAVVAALGVGGTFWLRRAAPDAPVAAPSVADVENARFSLVGLDSVADLSVGGR